jgi:hypothetical protein
MPGQPVVSVIIAANRVEATRPRAIHRPQASTPRQAIVVLDNLATLARAWICDDRLQQRRAPWSQAELERLSKEPARAG